MALTKSHTTPHGVTGNYWRILEHHINHDRAGEIDIALYVDAETRKSHQPLEIRHVNLGPDWMSGDVPAGPADRGLLWLSYSTLKTQAQTSDDPAVAWFKDAVDV